MNSELNSEEAVMSTGAMLAFERAKLSVANDTIAEALLYAYFVDLFEHPR